MFQIFSIQFFLYLIILASTNLANAQLERYYGAWISENDDMLLIYDTAYTEFSGSATEINDHISRMNVDLMGDTIRFWKKYEGYNSTDNYDFKIIVEDEYKLVLRPISMLSVNAIRNERVTFRKTPLIEEPFNFEKIVFIDSCKGHYKPCQLCFLQVEKNKVVRVKKVTETWNSSDSVGMTFFKGELDDFTFDRLIYLIRTAGFNRYDYNKKFTGLSIRGESGGTKTYVIDFNNKRLEFSSSNPPGVSSELNWFFYQLCTEYKLQETAAFNMQAD